MTITYYFWDEIERLLEYSIMTAACSHIMCLSSDYHDARSSSKLYKAYQHNDSISNLLKIFLLKLMPFPPDIITSFGYVCRILGFGMLVIVAVIAYLYFVMLVLYLSKKSGLDQAANEISEDVPKTFTTGLDLGGPLHILIGGNTNENSTRKLSNLK